MSAPVRSQSPLLALFSRARLRLGLKVLENPSRSVTIMQLYDNLFLVCRSRSGAWHLFLRADALGPNVKHSAVIDGVKYFEEYQYDFGDLPQLVTYSWKWTAVRAGRNFWKQQARERQLASVTA